MKTMTAQTEIFVVRFEQNPLKISPEKFGDLMAEFAEETTTPMGVGRVDYKHDNGDGTFKILSHTSKGWKGIDCESEQDADDKLLRLATHDYESSADAPEWFHTAEEAQAYIDEFNENNEE